MIVTEEEHSPAMEQGLQAALSYLEKEKLADVNQNRISLREKQQVAGIKAEEAGRVRTAKSQRLPQTFVLN